MTLKNDIHTFRHEIVCTEENLPVRLFYSNEKRPNYVPPHFHTDIEIIYLLTGCLTVNTKFRNHSIFPGDITLFNSNEIHSTLSEVSNTTAYVLQIPYKIIQQYVPYQNHYIFDLSKESECPPAQPCPPLNRLKELISDCCITFSRQPPFYQLLVTSWIYEILHILFSSFSILKAHRMPKKDFKYHERLAALTTYINEHYNEKLSLNTLAGLVSITPAYLSKFFKQEFETTLTDYITTIRLEHAYTDLLTTDYPILYIAEKNGFSNYQSFIQKFKNKYNATPFKIRQRHEP